MGTNKNMILIPLLLIFGKKIQAVTIDKGSVSKFYTSLSFPEDADYHSRNLAMSMSMDMNIPSTIVIPTITPSALSVSNDSPIYARPSSSQTPGPVPTLVSASSYPTTLNPASIGPNSANQLPLIPTAAPNPAFFVPKAPSAVALPSVAPLSPSIVAPLASSSASPSSSVNSPTSQSPTPPTITNSSFTTIPVATPTVASNSPGSIPTSAQRVPTTTPVVTPSSSGIIPTSAQSVPTTTPVVTPSSSGIIPTSAQSVPTTILNRNPTPLTTSVPVAILLPSSSLPAVKRPSVVRGGDNVSPVAVPNKNYSGLGAGIIVTIALAASLALFGVAYLYWKQRRVGDVI